MSQSTQIAIGVSVALGVILVALVVTFVVLWVVEKGKKSSSSFSSQLVPGLYLDGNHLLIQEAIETYYDFAGTQAFR